MNNDSVELCDRCGSGECHDRVRSGKQIGYMLIGHGTRSTEGTGEFLELARIIAERVSPAPLEASFLELQEPGIEESWQRLVDRGVDAIRAMPLLLFSAGHAKRDIPETLAQACEKRNRSVCFSQTDSLGCNPSLLSLSEKRFDEAVAELPSLDRSKTALVMVGRGSLDDGATAEMYRLSELRGQRERASVVRTGFVAMAHPRLPAVLEEVGQLSGIETVVVQPHLLFQGDLNLRVESMAKEAASKFDDRRWITTARLGPDPLLAEALLTRAAYSS